MSSLRHILASRANGARSRGPKTPQGKLRSSKNAIRHGLLARSLDFSDESQQEFQALLTDHMERFSPTTAAEVRLVEEMVAAAWRLRRVWAAETRLFNNAIGEQNSPGEPAPLAAAFSTLASSPDCHLLARYETRFRNIYQRGLRSLLLAKTTNLPNEPEK
jgi:hypothetical protein